ncbi:sugar transferase [Curtobacterium sp. UCD-KPL2560]|uniref:sugar transferase n=1 Tax=Curtobacterium sp. UCD-KPL2560 TaxID=1885315 RepID=UPI00082583B9|nr:sugar transferase [Curtobacterium sp. UCD-KPL2560]
MTATTTHLPVTRPRPRPWRAWGKRTADLLCALALLVVLAPLMGSIALLLLVLQGRPVLFRQRRTGLDGAPFTMLKFRTMRQDVDGTGTASDHLRVTRLGRVLRATSLDELPNLLNVVRGEMSVVGPRPMLNGFIEHHSAERHRRRHDVRPGITGLAQVNGRNDLDYVQRFEFDLEYVDRCSLWLDCRILARTIPAVLLRTGASAAVPCDLAFTDRAEERGDVVRESLQEDLLAA